MIENQYLIENQYNALVEQKTTVQIRRKKSVLYRV